EAAEALDEAIERASPALQREGAPREQIDRIRERLDHLEQRSRQFDLDFDLDDCVETWHSLGHDFAQLSGRHRDPLVLLLRHHRPAIDQATTMLSEAQRHEGLLREQHRKVLALQTDRDRARAKYERLRQSYLGAQSDWEAAQRQKEAQIPAQQHEVKRPPLPGLRLLRDERPSPLIVRLPVPKEGGPEPLPAVFRPAAIAMPPVPKLVATKKAEEKKPASPRKPRGPARIRPERIERGGGGRAPGRPGESAAGSHPGGDRGRRRESVRSRAAESAPAPATSPARYRRRAPPRPLRSCPRTALVRGANGPAGKAPAAPPARPRPPTAQRGRRPAGEHALAP